MVFLWDGRAIYNIYHVGYFYVMKSKIASLRFRSSLYFLDLKVGAIHDHSNYNDTLGMGELIVVLNGVEFRTRHNDYRLKTPSSKSRAYGATETIPFPDVPPEVSFWYFFQFQKAFNDQLLIIFMWDSKQDCGSYMLPATACTLMWLHLRNNTQILTQDIET